MLSKRYRDVWIVWLLGIGLMFLVLSASAYAAESEGKDVVYTSTTGSLGESFGDGTKENPYNRFEDAVANVTDGGTIYIMAEKSTFLNDQENDMPFVIDKSVNIEPEPGAERAVLSSRAAGIVLGADVSFTNIEFSFANPYHAQIFANGHSLSLANVSRTTSTRLVDVAAGSLYDLYGNLLGPAPGDYGQVIIQGSKSEFGNVYAGSINGYFNGDVSITVQNTKGAVVGDVYASGAKEAEYDRDNWFGLEEPPSPAANADVYPVSGKVNVVLDKATVRRVEGLGAVGGTEVSFATEYPNSGLVLTDLIGLSVEQGTLQPAELTARADEKLNLTVNPGGALDLSQIGDAEVNNFYGGGKLILGRNSVMRVLGDLTGKSEFETEGGYSGCSGSAVPDHVYIESNPESEGEFTFAPFPTQADLSFVRQEDGSWKMISNGAVFIQYWTEDIEMGDVSINWEMIEPENGVPEGATAEAKSGYHFVRWIDEEGNEVSRSEHFLPQETENGYMEAGYGAVFAPNTYKVAFDANGGSGIAMPEQEYVYGELQGLAENEYVYEGYSFDGWNTAADGTGTHFSDQQEVSDLTAEQDGTVILYAQWNGMQYTIHYDKNGATGGSMEDMVSCKLDVAYTLRANAFVRNGYKFAGWATEPNGAVVYKDKAQVKNLAATDGETKTLYAKWTANTYKIAFNKNGGTGSMSTVSRTYDKAAALPANTFSRAGYKLKGWNTKADGSGSSYTDKASVKNLTSVSNGTVTLYAQWSKINYTVKYVLNGGGNSKSNPSAYTVTSATVKLKNPTRTGYTFGGWYTSSSYQTKVTQITKGSIGNKTFYAKWAANKYTIRYNKNGATSGKMADTTACKYGTAYTLRANAYKRNGYTFAGWATTANGKVVYKNKASVKNLIGTNGGVKTLYAKWTPVTYKITYKLNGGTNNRSNPASYKITSNTITLKNPTRKGYTFRGWYSDSKYKTKVTKISKGTTGNRTLYARWVKK